MFVLEVFLHLSFDEILCMSMSGVGQITLKSSY